MSLLAEQLLNTLLKNRHLLTQALVLVSKALELFILTFPITCASCIHTLFYAALRHKLLIKTAQIGLHHFICHVEQREGYVALLLIAPFLEIRLVIAYLIVLTAKFEQCVIARVRRIPYSKMARAEIVLIVGTKFL